MLDGAVPQPPARRSVEPAGETAADVLQRYADEVSPKKRGGRWEQVRLKSFVEKYPVFQNAVTAISGPDIADWRDVRLVSVSASTVNRELCLLSTIFTHAMKEWRSQPATGLAFSFARCTSAARTPGLTSSSSSTPKDLP